MSCGMQVAASAQLFRVVSTFPDEFLAGAWYVGFVEKQMPPGVMDPVQPVYQEGPAPSVGL